MAKTMTDAEYGAHIRSQSKEYYKRWRARQAILNRKLAAAKITVTKAEVEAEMKNSK